MIFPDNVFKDLSNVLDVGQKQFDTFWNDRLVEAKIPVDDPLKKNLFLIPGKYEEKRKEKQKKLIYSNDTMNKLRAGVEV